MFKTITSFRFIKLLPAVFMLLIPINLFSAQQASASQVSGTVINGCFSNLFTLPLLATNSKTLTLIGMGLMITGFALLIFNKKK